METVEEYRRRVARAGGLARAKNLSKARRKEIAQQASKAAAKARKKKGIISLSPLTSVREKPRKRRKAKRG